MRVAHFIQRYPPALGGSEAYFARLGRHLAQCGDDVTVFTSAALDLEGFWSRRGRCADVGVSREDGVTVRRFPLWHCPGRRYLFKALSLIPHRFWQCLTLPCNPVCPRMWREATSGSAVFDVVHAAALPYAWPMACAWRLARRLRVPFLVTPFLHLGDPHDPADRTRRAYTAPPLRWLLRQADVVFVQTPSECDAVLGLGIPADRVCLQGLGVDAEECTGGRRLDARQAWACAADEVVVGHLANQSREKGTIDLVRAFEALWRTGMRLRLVLAGPEMPNFRSFWGDCLPDVKERIVRLGVLSERQKRDFFAGIDVFALPSRSDSFGLVLLEAWANGVPNIGYRAGGVADVIRHGRDGLLVPCGAIDELAAALRQLCVNGLERERLGRTGYNRLRTDFAWPAKLELVRTVAGRVAQKVRTDPAPKDAANLENAESVRIS